MTGESDKTEFETIVKQRVKRDPHPVQCLTKYELTAIIGFRAQQFTEGALPYIKPRAGMDPIAIALEEYDHNLIPLMVERPSPSNKIAQFKYASYRLDDLLNVNRPL